MIVAAFAAVYVIWGSTYIGIKIAITSLPPLVMAGSRYLAAGLLLFAWTRRRERGWPNARQWLGALIVGGLLLLGGNGGVSWAELRIPSGPASLLIAFVPLWMVLIDSFRTRRRPSGAVLAGLVLGLIGLTILIGPQSWIGAGALDPLGAAVLVLASVSWAAGSILSPRAGLPDSPLTATAMQMIAGGGVMFLLGLLVGEGRQVDFAQVRPAAVWAWIYLVLLGSLVGFTAYVYLLKVVPPQRVATYAYVNPVVAVLLGWSIGGEALGHRVVIATLVIVTAVAIMIRERGRG
jgi:drug/metabolite transporter (DMT)-like permease